MVKISLFIIFEDVKILFYKYTILNIREFMDSLIYSDQVRM